MLMFSSNTIIIHVWSYGGLRSSPLSRNRELMQRIARIGYLKLGVICKYRGRLALDEMRKRGELPRPLPLFFSPFPFSLSLSLSPSVFLFFFFLYKLDSPSSWTKASNNLCNILRYVFLLLLLLQRKFFLPFLFFFFLLSILLGRSDK